MSDEVWKAFWPEEGETEDDARKLNPPKWVTEIRDAEDAAQHACELDFNRREGWERGEETKFIIAIISPRGEITRWNGWFEMSVNHKIEPLP